MKRYSVCVRFNLVAALKILIQSRALKKFGIKNFVKENSTPFLSVYNI